MICYTYLYTRPTKLEGGGGVGGGGGGVGGGGVGGGGGGILDSPCPSVCPSVRLSVDDKVSGA